MFQFTTTNVINSFQDVTSGMPLWSLQKRTINGEEATSTLNIKRINNFKKENVVAIYKAEAYDAELAKITIDMSQLNDLSDGDQLRISLSIGLTQGSADSRYANDLYYKEKPFSVDFIYKTSWISTLDKLKKTINNYEIMVYGDKLLKVSVNGVFLTIEATSEYQRFNKVNVEKFDSTAYHGMGEYKVLISLDDFADKMKDTNKDLTGTVEGLFVGKEGFGTYSFLLHNLRLPTSMRTRAFGINQEETPIIGAKYNQYTIHYCVNRGILGDNAVGDLTKSLTTHVFYINQDLLNGTPEFPDGTPEGFEDPVTFESALETIAPEGKLIEVPTKKNDTDGEVSEP